MKAPLRYLIYLALGGLLYFILGKNSLIFIQENIFYIFIGLIILILIVRLVQARIQN